MGSRALSGFMLVASKKVALQSSTRTSAMYPCCLSTKKHVLVYLSEDVYQHNDWLISLEIFFDQMFNQDLSTNK